LCSTAKKRLILLIRIYYLGVIKRNFIYLDEDAFVMLYKSLVRSHLEYANSVWNPHRLGLIKDLEKV